MERLAVGFEPDGTVFQKPDPVGGQRGLYSLRLLPVVMVAEHRVNAELRVEPAEAGGDFFRGCGVGRKMPGDEIAGQQDQVGGFGVGGFDDPFKPQQVFRRRADMEIRQHRDPEPRCAASPARRGDFVPVHFKHIAIAAHQHDQGGRRGAAQTTTAAQAGKPAACARRAM